MSKLYKIKFKILHARLKNILYGENVSLKLCYSPLLPHIWS